MNEDMKNIFVEELKNLVMSEEFKSVIQNSINTGDIKDKKPKKTKSSSNATRPITVDEFTAIITAIKEGFSYFSKEENKTKKFRRNTRMAFALQLQANLGIRIGDVLSLTPGSFIPNGCGGYKINIIEEKTGKLRDFDVTPNVYDAIQSYSKENGIGNDDLLFTIKVRGLQKNLKIVSEHLGLQNVSTHSFRKFYAMRMFENNDYNFEIVRELLQHSSVAVTQKYLGVTSKQVANAIDKHNYWV